jgi:hypothetical protein
MTVPDVSGRSSHKVRHCIHNHREERGVVIVRPSHRRLTKSYMRRVSGFDFGLGGWGAVVGIWVLWIGGLPNINSR